jgi:small-conductance mechanosensitive channel
MTDEGVLQDVAERAAELATRTGVFVLLIAAVVLLGRILRPLVHRRLDRRGRPSYTRVFGALYSALVTLAAVLLAATLAFPSVQMVDVLASLGIVSVAVGFAFKDVLENLLAGVLLLLRDPFKSGDHIRVGDFEGVVEGVTVRETLLRTPAGQRVLLPNALVYTSPLEVLTHYALTRVTFPVVLDAGADLDAARHIAQEALMRVPQVRRDPAPDVVVTDAGVGQTTVECRLWTSATPAGITAARDAAIPAVLAALTSADVPLASGEVLLREADDDPADRPHAGAASATRSRRHR